MKGFLFQGARTTVVTACLAGLLALFLVAGLELREQSSIAWSNPLTWLAGLGCTLGMYMVLMLCWRGLDVYQARKSDGHDGALSTRALVLLTCLVCTLWLPVWFAAWPGFNCYDATAYEDLINDGILDAQQSLFHTLLVVSFFKISTALWGSVNGGVVALCGIQFLIAGLLVFACFVALRSLGAPRWLFIAAALFFALDPLISMFVFCTTKDVMFSLLFALVCFVLFGLVKGVYRPKASVLVLVTTLIVLVCLYRHNGLYTFVLIAACFFWAIRRSASRAEVVRYAAMFLAAFLVVGIWNFALSHDERVDKPSSVREMISLPSVQIARVASMGLAGDNSLYEACMVPSQILGEQYKANNSDTVRPIFWPACDERRYRELAQLYFSEGLAHPLIYADAVFALTEAAWSPFGIVDGYNNGVANPFGYDTTETSLFACWHESPATSESLLPGLFDELWHISRYPVLQSNPLTRWLTSPAFFLWIVLIALARGIIVRDRALVFIASAQLALTLTCLLGPVVLIRYYWFLMIMFPLTVGILFTSTARSNMSRMVKSDAGPMGTRCEEAGAPCALEVGHGNFRNRHIG